VRENRRVTSPHTYRDLTVWRVSLELVVEIYRATERFPRSELFGITSQLRRAAVSVCANLAEGNSRHSTAAYINHINVALGSLGELGALLEISMRLGYIAIDDGRRLTEHTDRAGRLFSGLRAALKRRTERTSDDGHGIAT